jgi:hypothetical protein
MKKFLSLFVALAMVLSLFAGVGARTAKAAVVGDVNNDGVVTMADALLIAQYLADIATLTPAQKLAADVNGDGSITMADTLVTAQIVANVYTPPVTDAVAVATAAVVAYEAAPITTLAEVTAAEALGVTANAKVALVAAGATKAGLAARVTVQKALVDAAKASFDAAAAYAALKAGVTTKVTAYAALANGGLTTQALVDAANTSKALISLAGLTAADAATFQATIDAANVKVAAAQAVIDDAAKVATATAAVVTAEASKLQVDVTAAQTLVTALPAGTVKTALQARINAIAVVSSVSAINPTIAVGAQTGFQFENAAGTVVAAPANITWAVTGSNASSAVISTLGVFMASAAGTYTVTATFSGTTLSTTVTVTGTSSSVTLAAASSSFSDTAADDVDTITATVVDSVGNILSSYNGTVQTYIVASNGSDSIDSTDTVSGSGTLAAPYVFTATNGTVAIKINAGGSPSTDVIYVGVPDSNGTVSSWQNITVTAVAPVATSLKPAYVYDDNTGTEITPVNNIVNLSAYDAWNSGFYVFYQVLDQSGTPIDNSDSGTYTMSSMLAYDDYTYTQNGGMWPNWWGLDNSLVMTEDIYAYSQTATGTIVFTPTLGGLTATPLTINLYATAESATQLILTAPPTGTSFTADAVLAATSYPGFQRYPVLFADANGNPVSTPPSSVNVTVLGPSGSASTAVGVWNGGSFALSTVASPVNVSLSSGAANVDLGNGLASGTTIPAGTYTVKIADATSGSTIPVLTETFTVTAGKAYNIVVKPSADPYDISSTSTTVTAQLVDEEGNNVALSGVVIDFAGTGYFSPSAPQVATNASGVATVTATDNQTTPAPGDAGQIAAAIDSAWVAAHSSLVSSIVNISPVYSGIITLISSGSAAASIRVTVSPTSIAAGDTAPTVTPSTFNGSGAPVTGDTLDWTLTGPTGYTTLTGTVAAGSPISSGTWPAGALTLAGTYTVTLTDASQPSVPTATKSFTVTPGAATGAAFFKGGVYVSDPIAVTANTPIAFTVDTVDPNGNPVATTYGASVDLSDGSAGGAFALAQGGTQITSVTIPAGQISVPVYYVNSSSKSVTFSTGYSANVAPATLSTVTSDHNVGTIVLTYSGALTANASGPVSSYVVTVNGGSDIVTGVVISGTTVTLALSAPINTIPSTVTITYTAPATNPVTDANLNVMPSFTNQIVAVS